MLIISKARLASIAAFCLLYLFLLSFSASAADFNMYANATKGNMFYEKYGTTGFSSRDTSTSDYTIKQFHTQLEVYDDGIVSVSHRLLLDTTHVKDVLSIFAYSPDSIRVEDENGGIKFATLGTKLIVSPQTKTDNYPLVVYYTTNTLTSKKENVWTLNYLFPSLKSISAHAGENVSFLIALPATATIQSFSQGGIVFNEGNNINVAWKFDLEDDTEVLFRVIYTNKPIYPIDYTKIGFFSFLFIAVLIVLVYVVRLVYTKVSKSLSKEKKDIIKTLQEKEREVVKLLLENKSQMHQSKIQKSTSISKATLSRIIKRLRDRNIVEIRESGNTNLIILQEWFVKK